MPAVAQVVGVARWVRPEEVAGLERALRPHSLVWQDGPARFHGRGEALLYGGGVVADVLNSAASTSVEVTGTALAPPGPFFCGFDFDAASARDAWWESFPAARAFVPELLLAQGPGGASLTGYALVRADGEAAARARAEETLHRVVEHGPSAEAHPSPPRAVSLREDRASFEALVSRALEALRTGMLRKVVLARALDVTAEGPFELTDALERAESEAGDAAVFALRAPDGTTFLGASPERLVRVQGRHFWTQALAGSAAPGEGERLAQSAKEVWEHAAVVEDVRLALDAVAESLEVGDVTAVSLGYVVHLDARIEGTLRPGVTPVQAALALHPTAAVSGAPRDRARGFLRAQERLARGWYTGGVGWVGAQAADLRVALRCALVRGPAARIFVGAGVVDGSTPSGEWAETGRKASPMLRALFGDTPWPL